MQPVLIFCTSNLHRLYLYLHLIYDLLIYISQVFYSFCYIILLLYFSHNSDYSDLKSVSLIVTFDRNKVFNIQ